MPRPNTPNRAERLGFRPDEETKGLIERAAHLSRRRVSDFCVTALADTARRTIAEHETLVLSDRDHAAFFEALVNPPEPSKRLMRAMAEHDPATGRTMIDVAPASPAVISGDVASRRRATSIIVVLCTLLSAGIANAQLLDGRWALARFACDGEAFTRHETPLLVEPRSVRWFNANCTIASSYKVNQTTYLQGRCNVEGRAETVPIMLEPRGDRLRVGWNREPIVEMLRCR
jgi:uncharacterized protein (DUF1778 family)